VKKNNGFTLIELMVVIVILGILAAVIAPRIPKFVEKAKENKTKANLANLRSALSLYYSDNNGKYPVTNALDALLVPKYLKELPTADIPPYHSLNIITGDNNVSEITPGDAGGWIYNYNNASHAWGDIIINCSVHTDSGGTNWSSY